MSQKASSDSRSPVVRGSCSISSWVSSRPRCLGPLAERPDPVAVGVAEIGASLARGVVGAGTERAPFRFLVTVLVLEEFEEEEEGGIGFGVLLGGLLLRLFAFDFGFVVTCCRRFGLELVPVEGRLQVRRVPSGLVPLCSAVSLAGFFMSGSRMPLVVALG